MKVLHAVGNFPIPPHGGMEATVYNLVGELSAFGVESKVIAPSRTAQRVVERNCEFIGVPSGMLSNWIRVPGWSGLGTLRRLLAWCDIVHVHNPPELFNVAVLEQAFQARRPIVLSMLSPGTLRDHPRVLFRWIGRADDRFLQSAMGHASFTQVKNVIDLAYVRRFAARSEVIPDGVSKDMLVEPRGGTEFRRRYSAGSSPVLLYVGRLHPMKGPDHLIQALPELRATLPDAVAWIAGPDPEGLTPSLQKLAAARSVGDRVRFLGTLSEADKREAIDAADVVVLPSLADFVEGFSIVASEAWARGKPVAAYPAGALRARVQPGVNGALAEDYTVGSLARAIVSATRIPAVTAPPDVVGWAEVARRFAEVYQGISRGTPEPTAIAPGVMAGS